MSFVPAIRDYIETLNNVYDSLSGDINLQIIVKETLLYFFVSIKCILTYFFSFQWLRNISYFPILVPQLHFSVLNETYFLQNPVSTIFTFLETPTYGDNKYLLGFLNSFFFCLPISCAHVICARRLLIQGIPAGLASGLGTILGQWWFATCILFGLRPFIIPWFSFEPFNFIIGIGLLLNILYEITHERSIYIITTKRKDETKLRRIFLLNLFLSWTEQSCVFQYFGNLTFGPEPTALEIFSSNTEIQSFLIHGSYLLGLLAGSFLFTGLFGFISIRLSNFIYPLFKYTRSKWVNLLNKGLTLLIMAFTFTSIPYYGIDYFLTRPLGFLPQDKALEKTVFSPNTVENISKALLADIRMPSINSDISAFDRGIYVDEGRHELPSPRYASFEDNNFQGETLYFSKNNRTRIRFSNQKDNKIKKFLRNCFGVKKKLSDLYLQEPSRASFPAPIGEKSQERVPNYSTSDDISDDNEDYESLNHKSVEEDYDDDDNDYKYLNFRAVGLCKRLYEELGEDNEVPLDLIVDENFLEVFDLQKPLPFTKNEENIKKAYYTNPVFKFLLSGSVDSFLAKQPYFQRLTKNEENKLFEKRLILGSYYDTLRYYNQLPYIEEFQRFFDGSKSYADRVFNQQFKGTFNVVRRLFSITVDPKENKNENSVLKFDQPLYLNSNERDYKPFHEELSQKDVKKDPSLSAKRLAPFLEISNSTPFYAGWDQGLRKLVITNRLLPRSFTGYALYSPKGEEYRTLANFIDSNKKIEFTTWPLSKSTLEKEPKSLSTIPYNVLFESIKDPKNEQLAAELDFDLDEVVADKIEVYPSNLFKYDETTNPPSQEVITPTKGGFIWPGNSALKFNFINTLKKYR